MSLPSAILARRMGLIAPRSTDLRHERDLPVPMDDGAVLLADRWVAARDADLRQPTVLVRSPYGRRGIPGLVFGRLLAERGLQVVVQSVRGTFGSQGSFAPFDERADGAATVRWLRTRPWHDGRLATFGQSYLGLTQWALAADPDARRDLAAMAVQVSASQFHDQTYLGGSLALETVASWLIIIALQERRLAPVRINRALRALGGLMGELPLVGLDERATGAPVAWLREGFAHPGREEDYWTRRDFSASVPEVEAPVSFVGGWYDILLPWMLEDFVALQEAGRRPRLLIGPWTHTSPELFAAGHRDAIAVLRAHLLGDERLLRAQDRRLPVRLRITGEGGGWREFARWPPAEAGELTLHLAAGGELRPRAPEAGEGSDGYVYDPADPTPSLGGPVLMSRHAVLDNAALEARADVLTYTGPPLTEAVEVIGRPHASIWVRGSHPDFDVFVRVCEVDAAGVSRNVVDALCSAAGVPDADADGARHLSFALWPVGHRFAAGHRIRLQVASGAHPRYARNPGTGEDPAGAAPETMRAVAVEVLRDAAHPSAITLPAIDPGRSAAGDGDGAGPAPSGPRN